MGAPKGHVKYGGRKKGVPNKLSGDVRAMVLSALDRAGGEDYLATQAAENPNAFMSLVGKTLPREIKAEIALGLSERMRSILARIGGS